MARPLPRKPCPRGTDSSGQQEACEWAPGEAPVPHKQVQGLGALWEKDKKEPGKELEPATWEVGLFHPCASLCLRCPTLLPSPGKGGPGNCGHYQPDASVSGWSLARGNGDGTPGQGEKPKPMQRQHPHSHCPSTVSRPRGDGQLHSQDQGSLGLASLWAHG
ncbi:hypothetical protein H1C71_032956, partial [Ictidomys tridecemlineatus]